MKEMMNKLHCKHTGLLLIRLGVAFIMIFAGSMKLMDVSMTAGFFASIGLASIFWVYLVGILEVVSGILMLVGAYTQIAGIVIAVIMLVAIILVKSKMGIQAMEIDIMLLASALGLVFTGPGKYALCKGLCGTGCPCTGGTCDSCTSCKDGKCESK